MHPAFSERLVRRELQQAIDDGLFTEHVRLQAVDFPIFYVTFLNAQGESRKICFECTNYNFDPVAIEPVDVDTLEPLPPDCYLTRGGGAFPSHVMRQGRPFLCLEGTRDFYTHEGHNPKATGVRWEQRRDEWNLGILIRTIAAHFGQAPSLPGGQWR